MSSSKSINTIFIHVPKTGGKSFYTSLINYGLSRPYTKHSTALHYTNNTKQVLPIVTLVRNPFIRIYSLYNYLKFRREFDTQFVTFERFVRKPKSYGHYFDSVERNPLQLETWVKDLDGNILVNDFIRMEYMQEDWSRVCSNYNLPEVLTRLNHKDDGKGENYTDHYTPELIEYVSQLCNWEIEKFNYSFDGISKRD